MKARRTLTSLAKVAGLAAITTAAITIAAPAGATVPGENGKIVFTGEPINGNYDISSVNPDGTGRTALTSKAVDEVSPTVSPDGKRVAYRRDDDIWVMNIDGTGQAPVTQTQM